MNEFEGLVGLGRLMKTSSATRGALIQLEGNEAFMVNEPKSITLHLRFNEKIGDGTFYAGEVPTVAEVVSRRDNKVLFQWKERGKVRRLFVPDKEAFRANSEEALSKYYKEPDIRIPLDFLDDLQKEILVTRLRIKGDEIQTTQKRSDGTVMLENLVKLNRGLAESEDYPDSGEVTVFTQDLFVLKGFVRNPLFMKIVEGSPVSIRGGLTFGAKFRGVISHLVYEV